MKNNIILLFLLLFSLSCSKSLEEAELVSSQKTRIESFVATSSYDFELTNGVYKAVVAIDTTSQERTAVEDGDSLLIDFSIYTFYSSVNELVFTTSQAVDSEAGFVDGDKNYEPMAIKFGTTKILDGINEALKGSFQGDEMLVLMTSDYGYGDESVGMVPRASSLAVMIDIVKVVKNL